MVAHLNLVRFLAMKFVNRGEPLDDLVQVGTLGLLKAIDRFDPERGVEFTTYATPTIVGEIKRHFRDKGWAVKVPRRLQELNQSVNRSVETLAIELGRSPTVAELAERLNASEEEILEAQELGQAYNLLSLDSEVGGDGDKKSQTLADTVGMTDTGMELLEDRANLERAFHVLDRPRTRDHLPALLRIRFANRDRREAASLADARVAPAGQGARKTARRPRRLRALDLALAWPLRRPSGGSVRRGRCRGPLFCYHFALTPMKSQELRQAWIDFFVAKGHKPLPSAGLIPDEMSTTLFTIAGMEQFVPVFLGEQPPPAPRAVTVQRCLRVAGAKSDIENVGRTGRHGTFLEMLGQLQLRRLLQARGDRLGLGVRHRT